MRLSILPVNYAPGPTSEARRPFALNFAAIQYDSKRSGRKDANFRISGNGTVSIFQRKRLSDVTCYIAGKLYAFADERSEEALSVEFCGILTILEKERPQGREFFELAEDITLIMIEAGMGAITITNFKRSKYIL